MSGSPNRTDVLVVGGGVIGLAAAWQLARAGASVRLVDASGTRGATWAAAGMLAPVSESVFGEDRLLRLNLAALARFPSFVAELEGQTEQQVGLRRDGTLVAAFNNDDRAALDRLSHHWTSIGLVTEALTASGLRALEPYLSSEVRGGVLAPGDWSVDNRRFACALRVACAGAGVLLVTDRVSDMVVSDDCIRGVRTDGGVEWLAGSVVLAAGCWAAQIAGLPSGLVPPVRPVKGQVLRLGPSPTMHAAGPVLSHTVRALVRGCEVYLVPRGDGELVVGATVEEQGFDETVTGGGVYQILRDACEMLPIISELALLESRAGLRPGTPDNGPVVGRSTLEGLVLAVGHYRNGILQSALTADAIVRLVSGADPGAEWADFSPGRFSRGANQ